MKKRTIIGLVAGGAVAAVGGGVVAWRRVHKDLPSLSGWLDYVKGRGEEELTDILTTALQKVTGARVHLLDQSSVGKKVVVLPEGVRSLEIEIVEGKLDAYQAGIIKAKSSGAPYTEFFIYDMGPGKRTVGYQYVDRDGHPKSPAYLVTFSLKT
jgi:hypothetical protein